MWRRAAGKTPKTDKAEKVAAPEPKEDDDEKETRPYEELIQRVSKIAKPLASKKLTKKLYKVGVCVVAVRFVPAWFPHTLTEITVCLHYF